MRIENLDNFNEKKYVFVGPNIIYFSSKQLPEWENIARALYNN